MIHVQRTRKLRPLTPSVATLQKKQKERAAKSQSNDARNQFLKFTVTYETMRRMSVGLTAVGKTDKMKRGLRKSSSLCCVFLFAVSGHISHYLISSD